MKSITYTSEWWMLLTPCIFMGLDLITGLIKAWVLKNFDSKKMRSGLGKKVGELVFLIIGEILTYSISLPKYIETTISVYIVLMEIMSNFENLDKLGVKIPKHIKDVINNTVDEIDRGDEDE